MRASDWDVPWCIYSGLVSGKLFPKRRHGKHSHRPAPNSYALGPMQTAQSCTASWRRKSLSTTLLRWAEAAQDWMLCARNASTRGWEVSFLRELHKQKRRVFISQHSTPYFCMLSDAQ